jgi:hypothetical protein
MWGNPLGSKTLDEKELEKIDPQIVSNLRKLKTQLHYLHKRDLCGWNPQDIDEDVEIAFNSLFNRIGQIKTRIEKDGTQSLTPHGCLEIDVNTAIKDLSKKGLTQKGRERVKEKVILSLIHDFAWWRYIEIRKGFLDGFTAEENEKIRQGTIHRLKSLGEDIHPILYDKYIFDFYDFTKWRKCFNDRFNCTEEVLEKAFDYGVVPKYDEILKKLELREKEIEESQKQKERRMSHICVLSYIYAIKWVEKIIGVNFLKSDAILFETWDVKRATFYNRMRYLYLVDNSVLELE